MALYRDGEVVGRDEVGVGAGMGVLDDAWDQSKGSDPLGLTGAIGLPSSSPAGYIESESVVHRREKGAGQMLTPQELAHTAEQYDEGQWFEFLDELDAVSRRRQRRVGEPAPPATADRDAMARWVARKHLVSDSGIREIWYFPQGAPPTRSDFSR